MITQKNIASFIIDRIDRDNKNDELINSGCFSKDHLLELLVKEVNFFEKHFKTPSIIEEHFDFKEYELRCKTYLLLLIGDVISDLNGKIRYGDKKYFSYRKIEKVFAQSYNDLYPLRNNENPLAASAWSPIYQTFDYEFYVGRYLKEFEHTEDRIVWLSDMIMKISFNAAHENTSHKPFTVLKAQCEVKLTQLQEERKMEILFDSNKLSNQKKIGAIKQSKIPAKFYALHCWCLIKNSQIPAFEINEEADYFPMNEIMNFCKRNYPKEVSDQRFYQEFKKIDITDKNLIFNNFGSDFRSKILSIDNNTKKMASFLRSYFKLNYN